MSNCMTKNRDEETKRRKEQEVGATQNGDARTKYLNVVNDEQGKTHQSTNPEGKKKTNGKFSQNEE